MIHILGFGKRCETKKDEKPMFACPRCGTPTDNPGEALMHCEGGDR